MREIKFRAWLEETKRMFPFDLCSFGEYGYLIVYDENTDCIGAYHHVSTKDVPVMQYTGLKDKNGKEIYEGDIVRFGIRFPRVEVVEWLDGAAGFDPFVDPDDWDDGCSVPQPGDCEIIGNLYENPELVNEMLDFGQREWAAAV